MPPSIHHRHIVTVGSAPLELRTCENCKTQFAYAHAAPHHVSSRVIKHNINLVKQNFSVGRSHESRYASTGTLHRAENALLSRRDTVESPRTLSTHLCSPVKYNFTVAHTRLHHASLLHTSANIFRRAAHVYDLQRTSSCTFTHPCTPKCTFTSLQARTQKLSAPTLASDQPNDRAHL